MNNRLNFQSSHAAGGCINTRLSYLQPGEICKSHPSSGAADAFIRSLGSCSGAIKEARGGHYRTLTVTGRKCLSSQALGLQAARRGKKACASLAFHTQLLVALMDHITLQGSGGRIFLNAMFFNICSLPKALPKQFLVYGVLFYATPYS